MSNVRVDPSADASQQAIRHSLADAAGRELDALRAALDVHLSALEAALAHPDPRTSREELVLNLARVAHARARASAPRAARLGQLAAQAHADAAVAEAQRALDAERAIAVSVRSDLE